MPTLAGTTGPGGRLAVFWQLLDGLGAAVDAAGGTSSVSCTTVTATAARLAS